MNHDTRHRDTSTAAKGPASFAHPKSRWAGGLSAVSWAAPRGLAVVFFVVLFVWIYQAEGGIGTQDSNLFGLHALLMSLFVVLFTQEAVMAYGHASLPGRLTASPAVSRNFHVICHGLGLACAIGGLVAIIYYKRLSTHPIEFPFYTLYSPHSWVAIAFLSLWLVQLLAGFCVHTPLCARLGESGQLQLRGYHRFLGKFVYATGLATCALGFQDMQSSDLAGSTMPADVGTTAMIGYLPHSKLAGYSSACALLLLFLGFATFAAITAPREDLPYQGEQVDEYNGAGNAQLLGKV